MRHVSCDRTLIRTFTLVRGNGDSCAMARPFVRSDDGGGEVEVDHILGAPGGSSRRKRSLGEPAAGGAAAPGFDC